MIKQSALIEDVKRSVAIVGDEKAMKNRSDEIKKQTADHADRIRKLTESNRKTIRHLNEEIKPRLNMITNKIKLMESSKDIKLEVGIGVCEIRLVRLKKILVIFNVLVDTNEIRSSLSRCFGLTEEPKSISW